MLLLVEIALSIFASRRGWKGYAAIPLSLALVAGFVFGVIAAMVELERDVVIAGCLALDGVVILALAAMCAVKGPYPTKQDHEATVTTNTDARWQKRLTDPRNPYAAPLDGYQIPTR